jgi:hypothetical protein
VNSGLLYRLGQRDSHRDYFVTLSGLRGFLALLKLPHGVCKIDPADDHNLIDARGLEDVRADPVSGTVRRDPG